MPQAQRGEIGQQRGQIAVSRTQHQRLAVMAQHPFGFADQLGQLAVGQYGMTFEVYSREGRLRVVVGHEI